MWGFEVNGFEGLLGLIDLLEEVGIVWTGWFPLTFGFERVVFLFGNKSGIQNAMPK